MAISLDDLYKDEITGKGGVSVDTTFTGELSGSIENGVKLASLRGTTVSEDAIQDYEGYIKLGGELTPTRLVYSTLQTTGGNVRGDFDDGLNLKSIYNSSLVDNESFGNNGEGLVYKGGELYVEQLHPYRIVDVTTTLTSTNDRDYLKIDCSLPDIVIPLPTNPTKLSYVLAEIVKGDPQVADHAPKFTATAIEGDTEYELDRSVRVVISYNGDEWRILNG